MIKPITQNYKLLAIKKLNFNVFELIFEGEEELKIESGQFITFLVPGIGARSYSILKKDSKKLSFIIKKVSLNSGGRGGSRYICEMKIGDELKGIGACGNFVLKQNNKNKIFLGTGVGIVPFFYQINYGLENNFKCNFKLIFGVRSFNDVFYLKELKELEKKYINFSFSIYLSREDKVGFKNGYITKEINKNLMDDFEESYVCGSPNVVDDVKKILIENGFDSENIFEEKY